MKSGDFLFVYGTLRRGEGADLSKQMGGSGACFISHDRVNGELYNLGWFPGAKAVPQNFDPGAPSIHGDVFLIRDKNLSAQLDAYEGYPSLYDRIETETAGARHVWIYTYNHEVIEQQKIPSGDWKERNGVVVRPPLVVA